MSNLTAEDLIKLGKVIRQKRIGQRYKIIGYLPMSGAPVVEVRPPRKRKKKQQGEDWKPIF